jgi:hypothetical protein
VYRHVQTCSMSAKESCRAPPGPGPLQCPMAGDIELFKEMRRAKSVKNQMEEMAETVDGVSREQGVADTFAKIFCNLYNSSGSRQEMTEL